MDKKEVRKQIRDLKKGYSLIERKEKSRDVWNQIEENPFFRNANTVLLYWSMDDEIHTHDFIQKWAAQKLILLPCVAGDELEIRRFESYERLCPGEAYAIPEPVGELFTDLNKIDVIIVPGVAFDCKGNRLGRGKGYYDKMLCNTSARKIGVCFDFQLLNAIPTDDLDVCMDEVIACRK